MGLFLLGGAAARATVALPQIPVERYRLPNGLEVLLHVDHGAPLVHIEVWYKVGSKDEAPGMTGFAHLFEHMMFEGTKQIPKGAIMRYLAHAGASERNAATSVDRTAYYETLPSSELELGLWLESSRMGFLLDNPRLREAFTKQRDVVENERRETVENVPIGGADRVELEALFPVGHPYRHEVVGSMADLKAATAGELREFFDRYYAPNNAVLLVAGDLEPSVTKAMIEKYFASIPAGARVEPARVARVPSPPHEQRIDMEAGIELPQGRMAWNTVPLFAPGDADMDMLADILAGDRSSRLYRRLVYQLRIAQSVSAFHQSRELGGTLEIDYTAMAGHRLAEIEKVIDEEIQRLQREPPSLAEIERARNQIETDSLRDLQDLAGVARHILYYDVFAGDPSYLRQDFARYDQATPASLTGWARALLGREHRVVIAVAPKPDAPIMGRVVASERAEASSPARRSEAAGPPRAKATNRPAIDRKAPDAAFRETLPASGATRRLVMPKVARFTLRGGLSVILAEDHTLPLVDVDLTIKTGSAANPPAKPGLASFVADMLDQGTKRRTAIQVAKQVAQLGASLSSYATWDASTVSLSVQSRYLNRALPILAEVVIDPVFAGEDIKRMKENLNSVFDEREDYPTVVATDVLARTLWGDGHPFAWPETGTAASIARMTRADMKRFHDTYYVPNNALLSVAGDVTPSQLRAALEPLLASWRPRPVPALHLPAFHRPDRLRIVLVDKPGTPQSSIRIGCQAIARKSPDYYRALLANHILGGAFRRLSMSLREDKGWTYGVTSEIDARREVGPWTIGGEFVAAHTADAVVEILRQVDRLGRELVPAQELADAQAELIGAYPASLASAGQVVDKLTTLAIDEMPARTLERFVDGIKHVDSAQILDVARRYFRAGQLVVVIVGDGASIEAGLRKIGEVERRDLDGNLINPGHKEDAHERIDSSSSSDKARGPTGLVSPAAGADCARTRCGAVLRLRGHGLEQRVRHLGHLRQEGRRIATGHR